jgi:hypothetical protein
MVQAVGELPGVRLTSVRELNGRFAAECGPIKHGALARLAQSAAGGEIIGVDDPAASPAQLLDLLSRAGQRWSGGTRWATPMLSRTVLGPDCLPPALDREVIVPGEHVRALCHSVASYIDATGRLPSRVDAGGVPVGPGPLIVGLARWFESANRGGDAPDLTLRPGPEEPAIAAPLVEKQIYRSLPGWPPHRPDLRLDQLALHLRLQTWSLKPAVLAT